MENNTKFLGIEAMASTMKWREAVTYRDVAPHEYVLEQDYRHEFKIFSELIHTDGKDESFTMYGNSIIYKYLYWGDYRYWVIDDVLNRCPANAIRTNL